MLSGPARPMTALPAVNLARLRAALAASGSPPRRRHGQHFLVDHNLLALIAREGGAGPRDTVLEIGPGPGLLTRHLLAAGAQVVAVEIDPRVRGAAMVARTGVLVRMRSVGLLLCPPGSREPLSAIQGGDEATTGGRLCDV